MEVIQARNIARKTHPGMSMNLQENYTVHDMHGDVDLTREARVQNDQRLCQKAASLSSPLDDHT